MVPPEQQDTPSGAEGGVSSEEATGPSQTTTASTEPYKYYDDPYDAESGAGDGGASATAVAPAPPAPPPPPAEESEDHDEDEEGMVRMSFFEHLDELRKRLLSALGGCWSPSLCRLVSPTGFGISSPARPCRPCSSSA